MGNPQPHANSTLYWLSAVPNRCQNCLSELNGVFFDAPIYGNHGGPWGIICPKCFYGPHDDLTRPTGLGLGQRYVKQPDGKWKDQSDDRT